MIVTAGGSEVTRWGLRSLLFGVYFAEGLVTAMFGLSYLYLTSVGVDGSQLGVIIFIALTPLFLKPVTGYICDKVDLLRIGRRKSWLLFGLGMQAAGFVVLSTWSPAGDLALYLGGMLLVVFSMIFYDVSIDGYAIEQSRTGEYGRLQGWMTSGRYLSVLVAPLVATSVASWLSWSAALLVLAALSALPILALGLVQEAEENRRSTGRVTNLLTVRNGIICLIGFFAMLATSGTEEVYLAYYRDELGTPLPVVGILGTLFGIGVVAGALLSPEAFLRLRLGFNDQTLIALAFAACSALLIVVAGGVTVAVLSALFFGVAMGVVHVAVFSYGMHVSVRGVEATGFSIFSFFLVSGTVVAMTLAPWLIEAVGFRVAIAFSVIPALLGAACVVVLRSTNAVPAPVT